MLKKQCDGKLLNLIIYLINVYQLIFCAGKIFSVEEGWANNEKNLKKVKNRFELLKWLLIFCFVIFALICAYTFWSAYQILSALRTNQDYYNEGKLISDKNRKVIITNDDEEVVKRPKSMVLDFGEWKKALTENLKTFKKIQHDIQYQNEQYVTKNLKFLLEGLPNIFKSLVSQNITNIQHNDKNFKDNSWLLKDIKSR